MTEFREKYISPFTDYGFKRLFGKELLKEQEGRITTEDINKLK